MCDSSCDKDRFMTPFATFTQELQELHRCKLSYVFIGEFVVKKYHQLLSKIEKVLSGNLVSTKQQLPPLFLNLKLT